MYNFLFDPTYITLFVIALLIFLVMFLWRKITIVEGNFFILEKRVNLIKKESRDNSLSKNLERSNIVMNEIFSNSIPEQSCKSVGSCSFPLSSEDIELPNNETQGTTVTIVETITKVSDTDDMDENVKISFNNTDLDKRIEDAIDPVDIINAIDKIDTENDNASSISEFTLNTDDKYNQKKLSKLNLDKIKNICMQLNLNTDGTKAQLIAKILECNK